MSNFKGGRWLQRTNSTVSSAGTLTLLNNSARYQRITGSTSHTVQLPDASTMFNGQSFIISNRGTGSVTVNFGNATLAATLAADTQKTFFLDDNSTVAGAWDISNEATTGASGAISIADTLSILSALSNQRFEDASDTTQKISFNPEEIGGNYWKTISPMLAAVSRNPQFAFGGFMYNIGGQTDIFTVERYDDTNNYWLSRTSISSSQGSLSGCFDIGDFGYSAGGNSAGTTQTSKYDPIANSWTVVAALPTARSDNPASALSGYGYVPGGSDAINGSIFDTNYRYDATANSWSTRTKLITPRYIHYVTNLNNFLYAYGGQTTGPAVTTTGEKYSDHTNTWSSIAALLTSTAHVGGFSMGGFAYARHPGAPGAIERYADFSNSWSTVASSVTEHDSTKGISLNSFGFLSGGAGNTVVERYSNSSFLKIPLTKKSTGVPTGIYAAVALGDLVTSLPVQIRTDGDNWKTFLSNQDSALKTGEVLTKKFLESGLVYAGTGGTSGNVSLTSTEFYNPSDNTWTSKSNIGTGRIFAAGFAIDGFGFIAGGSGVNLATNPINSVEKFDEIKNIYTVLSSVVPVAKEDGASFKLIGLGYFIGGSTSATFVGNAVATNYQYNATLDSWAIKTAMTAARVGQGFSLLDRGYFAGGADNAGTATDTLHSYNTISDSWATKAALPSTTAQAQNNCFHLNEYGYNVASSASASAVYKYNQNTNAWATVTSTTANRTEGAGTESEGYGYIISNGSALTSAEKYNDAANSWFTTGTMNVGREGAASSFSPGAYRNYEFRVALPAFIAGVGGGVWTVKANLNTGRAQGAGFHLNGFGLVCGGLSSLITAEIYNLESNVWRYTASMPAGDQSIRGCSLLGFGYTFRGSAGAAIIQYNDQQQVWATKASDPNFGGGHAIPWAQNGFMFATGGAGTLVTRRYNPDLNTFTGGLASIPSIGGIMYYAAAETVDGFGYVVGDPTSPYNLTSKYNDSANTWTALATTGSRRDGLQMFVVGKDIHIAGGNNSTPSLTCEKYLIGTNVWTAFPSMSLTHDLGLGFSMNGVGIVAGGDNNTLATEQYTPSLNNFVLGLGLRVTES